jgi:DnaJ-domain-containing protein 1
MNYPNSRYNRAVGKAYEKFLGSTPAASNLTPEEYFVWSQIGQKVSLQSLLSLCPWPENEALQKIEALIQKNSAHWVAPKAHSDSEIEKILQQDEKEGTDLDRSFRADVLVRFHIPADANAYGVLELEVKSSETDIKAKYLALSKKFHPDRFFKKNLGHYKTKLDTIFTRIQNAYQILKNPIEKEELDRMLILKARSPENVARAPKKMAKLNKEMEKFGKAEFNYKAGLAAEKNRDYLTAYHSFVIALQLDPKRDVFTKALDRVRPLVHVQKAEDAFNVIKSEAATSGVTPELLKRLEDVLKIAPLISGAQLLMGRFLLEIGPPDKLRDAKEMLLRAKAADASSAEPCYYLARVFEALNDHKAALREVNEALKRNPRHASSKKLLGKLS